jgi:O-antigen/teichoic acid export membrane protein
VSKERGRAASYLLNTTVLRLGAAVVASLPMVALIAGTNLLSNPFSRPEMMAIGFIMLGMVISGMSKGVTGLFYVYEKAEVPAAMSTATTILKVGFGVLALLLGYGFVGLAAVSILTNLITLGLLVLLATRSFALRGPWRVDWRLQGRMVRLGFPLMLIHLLQTVFISVDVYLLRTMLPNGEEVVGWYSSAYKWFNALQIVPSFFTLALFPIISREIERSVAAARRMYQMALKIMLLLALPVAALVTFLAYPMVQLLGGNEFLPHGAIALQIVIWSIPVGWLNSVTNYVLIALGLEGMQPRAFAIAVGFNIVANGLFIPRFGYVAAAVTTILSEVVLLGLFAYYLRQRMPGVGWGRLTARPLLVAALMVGGMWLVHGVNVWLTAVVGVATYFAGLWLFRIIGDDEKQVLRAVLPAALIRRLHFLQ